MRMLIFIVFLIMLFTGCSLMEREVDISIDDVPTNIMDAAMTAVPGLTVESAEIETEDSQKVYEIEGVIGDEEVEIDIAEDGTILEIEREVKED